MIAAISSSSSGVSSALGALPENINMQKVTI